MDSFSSKHGPAARKKIIQQLCDTHFDLLVIGGGITGAGIALDAAARGLKVALIEMQDFASGTSGRSTKLIHGGLRYLKQFEFKLVAEVGKEREIIYRNAPHITSPEKMLLPIVKNGSLGKFTSRLGMWVYEWLAGVKKEERHQILNKEKTLLAEPLLKQDDLLGGIIFYEYRTDDARLTIEVLKEAVNRGTVAVNYFKSTGFIYENHKISGATTQDQISGNPYSIKAKYVVNAGGPWVDELDRLDKNNKSAKLHITKGVHIVVDKTKLPVKQSLYFDTFDKRMIFVIPRDGKIYIGTTDTFYEGDLVNPLVTEEDQNYLLKCVNNYFPKNKIERKDIESAWAGLRPLINKPGKGPSEISRKDEIFFSGSGLITIAGGKLTGYRKMAERVVNIVSEKIPPEGKRNIKECTTDEIKLSGGKINEAISFAAFAERNISKGIALGLSRASAETSVKRYGSNTEELFKIIEKLNKESHELPVLLRAELMYAIENEMCMTPSDFFIRRTGLIYFDIESVKKWKTPLVSYMQNIMLWSGEETERFSKELDKAIEHSSGRN